MRLDARKKIIAIKAETTRGTYAAPANTDMYNVWDLDLQVDPQVKDMTILQNSTSKPAAGLVMGAIYATVTFKMMAVFGSAADDSAHVTGMTRIWNACGLKVDLSTTVMLKPDDATNTSVSIVVNIDGRARTVRAASGNCKLVVAAGEIPYWDITLTGVYTGTTETAALAGTPYTKALEVYTAAPAITLQPAAGTAAYACMKTITVDPGYSVAPLADLGAAQGVKHFSRTTPANPRISFSCNNFRDTTNSAQYDAETDAAFRANTLCTFVVGTNAVNATGVIVAMNQSEENGWMQWDCDLDLRGAAMADWLITIYLYSPV